MHLSRKPQIKVQKVNWLADLEVLMYVRLNIILIYMVYTIYVSLLVQIVNKLIKLNKFGAS